MTSEKRKSPHSSVPGHWSTEMGVLKVLERRSRSQHRHQVFLQRLRHVIRLGRIMDIQFKLEKDNPTVELLRLCYKMQTALRVAGTISTQMIHLRHFLPLQTALMAAYSRLHAITLTYTCHASSTENPSSHVHPGHVRTQVEDVVNDNDHTVDLVASSGKDQGEKLERVLLALDQPLNESKQVDQPVQGPPRKKRLREKDTMDDIFGF